MIVEEIAARFGLEVDQAAFSKIEAALHGLHKGAIALVGVFGAVAYGVASIVESTGEAGDAAAHAAEKFGLTTQAFQGLSFAAKMADVDQENFSNGLKFLNRNAAEAAQGSEELQKAFAQAGVKIHDAHGKIRPTSDLLLDLSEKFKTMPAGAAKVALAMKLLGRSGTEMIPFLNQGKDAIGEFQHRAEELGLIMSDETIKDASAYDDAIKEVGSSLVGLRNAIGGPLLKSFTVLVKGITTLIVKYRQIIATPIVGFFKALAGAVAWLGEKSAAAEFVLGALVTGLQAAGIMATVLGAQMVAAGVASAAAWLLAAAPIIALGAIIGLIADDLYVFSMGGDSVLGRLLKWFDKIDPTDNPLINAFKLIGQAITDVFSPDAGEKFYLGMSTLAGSLVTMFVDFGVRTGKAFAASFLSQLLLILPAPMIGLLGQWTHASEHGGAVATQTTDYTSADIGAQSISRAVRNSAAGSAQATYTDFTPGETAGAAASRAVRNAAITVNVHTQPGADAHEIGGVAANATQKAYREAAAALK